MRHYETLFGCLVLIQLIISCQIKHYSFPAEESARVNFRFQYGRRVLAVGLSP